MEVVLRVGAPVEISEGVVVGSIRRCVFFPPKAKKGGQEMSAGFETQDVLDLPVDLKTWFQDVSRGLLFSGSSFFVPLRLQL